MLCDETVTFPMLYHHYLSIAKANDVPALPRYKVLVYVGKEFGGLMSSVSPRNRVGRILYRTKCDPFLMLSRALGTTKSKPQVGHARGHVCEEVAGYLNEKVHELSSQLIAEREQGPVVANTFNLEAFERRVDPDLWETVNTLTFSTYDKCGLNLTESDIKERHLSLLLCCAFILGRVAVNCSELE